jgi:hypothetical protein
MFSFSSLKLSIRHLFLEKKKAIYKVCHAHITRTKEKDIRIIMKQKNWMARIGTEVETLKIFKFEWGKILDAPTASIIFKKWIL